MDDVLTAERLRENCSLGDGARAWATRARGLGLVALAIAAGLGFARHDEWRQFLFSYLTAYATLLAISLGALFFLAVNHTVGAKWMVVVRRIAEQIAAGFPLLAVLFLPILLPVLFGNHSLYHWTDPHAVESDHLLHVKAPFLNVPFFAIRCVIYFTCWILMARFFLRLSREQDLSGDPLLTARLRRRSPLLLIVFALTTTFAAFDLLMSLEPHWFSTIFGVYFFAGGVLAFFATMIVICMALQESGRLQGVVTVEHYHDLGKYLFAFTFFWGYIAFSQYMLIWYANLPEETFWFLKRQEGSWTALSVFLLFGHFLIPFAGLLSRHVKRNKTPLAFWAVVILFMHWVDMYWLVMPARGGLELGLGAIDVLCLLGLLGLFAGGFLARARTALLAPVQDPYWRESLAFKNL